MRGRLHEFARRAFAPSAPHALALFRIVFGVAVVWEVERYFRNGWIQRYWVEPTFNFGYPYLYGLPALPEGGLVALYGALGVAGALLALGVLPRVAAAAIFLGFGYTFLLESARYLNHMYLIVMLAMLLAFCPTGRALSLPAWLRARRRPDEAAPTVPSWTVWLLRAQVGIPYLYGGIAKLNPDWLRAMPLRLWLAGKDHIPFFGWFADAPWFGWFLSYGGLLLDLAALPLLLWPRTRTAVFAVLVAFHISNATLFNIGVFPWLMIGATTIFYPASWPRDLWRDLRRGGPLTVATIATGAALVVAVAVGLTRILDPLYLAMAALGGAVLGWRAARRLAGTARDRSEPARAAVTEPLAAPGWRRTLTVVLVTAWITSQALIPLRHYLQPERASWTEQGHRFSWHMMLRTKVTDLRLIVTDLATGQQGVIDPGEILPSWQYSRMRYNPEMILQFAHYTAERFAASGYGPVSVRADSTAALNGRPMQPLIDPSVDLTTITHRTPVDRWIVPLRPLDAGSDPAAETPSDADDD